MKHLLLLFVLAASLSGCATTNFQAYPGSVRPASQVAIVYGVASHEHKILKGLDSGVAIIKVDGEETSNGFGHNYAFQVTVLPGKHYFNVRWGHFGMQANGKIWIPCEAGETYAIHWRTDAYKVFFWAEDVRTGKVVGGVSDS